MVMIGDPTKQKIKDNLAQLVENHFDQIVEVYNSQGQKITVDLGIKMSTTKKGTQVTVSISFVKTRIKEAIEAYTDDEQMSIE